MSDQVVQVLGILAMSVLSILVLMLVVKIGMDKAIALIKQKQIGSMSITEQEHTVEDALKYASTVRTSLSCMEYDVLKMVDQIPRRRSTDIQTQQGQVR